VAQEIRRRRGGKVRDLTGTEPAPTDFGHGGGRRRISQRSGLMHIAAAIGTPTMGIFGPTDPYLWAPLNGLAATVLTRANFLASPASARLHHERHRCMRDISAVEGRRHRAARAARGDAA